MFIDINNNKAYQEGYAAGKAKSLNKRLRPKNPYTEPEWIGKDELTKYFRNSAVYTNSEWSEWDRGYNDGLNTCPHCGQIIPKEGEKKYV